MASNGGTLHGVPQSVSQQQQQQQQQHICSQCGLYFESASSLQVHHMHYHQHDSMNRWGSQQQPVVSTTLGTTAVATTTTTATTITTNGTAPSSTTPTSSDTENNNQPGSHTPTHTTAGLKPVASPHTTIAAAADSSDNQPPTPQPTITEPGTPQSYGGGGTSPYHTQQQQQQQQQQQHQQHQQVGHHPHQLGLPTGPAGSEMHYPSYIHPGYDPGSYYSGGPGSGLDYGSGVLGAPLQPTDYKSGSSVVSSARYHPYGGGSSGSNGGGGPDGSSPTVVSSNGGSAGMSPQVVSSSNGVTVAGSGSGSTTVTTVASTTSQSSQPSHSPPNGTGGSNIPPTPSPSPIQCEKCGMVCESDEALNEHEATIHSNVQAAQDQQQRVDQVDLQGGGGGGGNCYSYGAGAGGTPVYPVKEEAPASDILDLDSQKMVGYGPAGDGGLLPPMNSLHPLQSMQRHPMMSWHDPHNFMGPPSLPPPHPSHGGGPDMKHSAAVAAAAAAAAYYHHPIKSEYSATPAIKSEYLGGGGGGHYSTTGSPIVKNEYSLPPTLPPPAVAPQPTNAQTMKQYADEMHDNQLATSPSDFPSTTTPQESGSQYRTFEPATSSLPGTAGPTKGTAWKSNEARRPKTYNCTACNKWFTSSGHLKRHYNTTLHKNAVKSSGQPDPATLPISVHHHPGRDPNYANKGRRGGAGNGSGAGSGGGGSGGGGGAGGGGAGSQIQQPIQQPVPPPDPPRSPEYGTGPGAQQYGGASAGFSTAGNSPGHQHPGSVGQVVSSNQSPGFHHPYAGATSANGTTASSTSSAVPPNGVAGPSVQVSQPRGLQIYSNSSNSHSMAEQMEQATHTITTILTPTTHPHTSTVGIPDTLGTRISTSTTRTPTDTHTPPTMGMGSPVGHLQQQQQPLQQQPPPPQHIISSMEPYHHPHTQPHTMHTISNPLTISTSIPSFQTILPEAPSYHLIIGNAAHHQQYASPMGMMAGNDQWIDGAGGDGLIESTTGDRNGSLGFPRCSGGAEVYQGDTAPPFSPNVPDQYQRPTSSDGTTILTNLNDQQQQQHHQQQHRSQQMMIAHSTMGNKYKEYTLQQHVDVDPYQEQLLYRVATPQLGATAPAISPAPCSPSVTSTDVGQTQLQSGQVESAKSNKTASANGQPEVHRCIECDKVFNKVCYLTQHNKTFHSGDKPYKCHRCGKRFPCNQSYEEHLAKHGGEKPFKCEQCPKQFNHKTDLRRHMCLHSGSKPYACEQCGKGFIRKDHMIKHSETHRKNVAGGQERGGNGVKRTGKAGGGMKKGGKKDIVGLVDE
ncbi:mediator of RNA polymerase II transcription subunit 1-like isoform X1 [Anopheles maculipalpis]|uniref:mediator of RNA polymerase II transcription subunit 1-like isoform X1 n=1 Tax=Anopheles maculipalpis TaxID=1496333 RepID=UPI00215903B6|nr:mediator of RNA polymerase II transcription subunit 1-like isoform X1 [Anopheles maculipalpis]